MRTSLPAPLVAVVRDLLSRHPTTVTLDEIAEAIGDLAVTPPQIAEIMRLLESQQRTIEQKSALDLAGLLRDVLGAARHLQGRGHTPTVQGIADHLEVPPSSVHAALLFSRTLGDPA